MDPRRVLILGGTGEARELASRLTARRDLRVTVSLAGRTKNPLPQEGDVRTGGFGGADGLARYLRDERVSLIVDATHPFAARISANAVVAAKEAGIPVVVLDRPAWEQLPGDRWALVDNMAEAARHLGDTPRTVFLAIGRQELALFQAAPQHAYIVRTIDPVDPSVSLLDADYILDRGPFAEDDERRLFAERGVEILVAKNSGGCATYAKIAAARRLGIPVIMVRRPSAFGGTRVFSVDEAVAMVDHLAGAPAERGA